MWHQFWRLFSHHISNTQFSFGLFPLFFIAIVFCRIKIFTWYRSLLFYGNKYVSRCCVTSFKDEFMNECNDEMPSLKFPWKCFVYSLAIYSKNWKWCTPFMDFYFRYIFLSLLGSPSYTCKSRTWTKWFFRRFLFTPFVYFFSTSGCVITETRFIHSFISAKQTCEMFRIFKFFRWNIISFRIWLCYCSWCEMFELFFCIVLGCFSLSLYLSFSLFVFFSLFYFSVNKILTRKRKKIMANFR